MVKDTGTCSALVIDDTESLHVGMRVFFLLHCFNLTCDCNLNATMQNTVDTDIQQKESYAFFSLRVKQSFTVTCVEKAGQIITLLLFIITFPCIVVLVPQISWPSEQLTQAAAKHKIPPLLCCLKNYLATSTLCVSLFPCITHLPIFIHCFLFLYEIIRFLRKRIFIVFVQNLGCRGLIPRKQLPGFLAVQIIINATAFSVPQYKGKNWAPGSQALLTCLTFHVAFLRPVWIGTLGLEVWSLAITSNDILNCFINFHKLFKCQFPAVVNKIEMFQLFLEIPSMLLLNQTSGW